MGVSLTLKHIKELAPGRFEYRRRVPDPDNLHPDNALPGHTLEDARNLYIKEKLGGGQGDEHREALARVERVMQRVIEALGDDARTRPLDKLKREDARKVRDHMLQSPRKGGGVLSPASVKRELKTLAAVINFGLKEFDLGGAVNPFDSLPVQGSGGSASMPDADKRDPLPAPVVEAVTSRLKGDLHLIWRILAGTGCRLGEVTGLRSEDVILSGMAESAGLRRIFWRGYKGSWPTNSSRPDRLASGYTDRRHTFHARLGARQRTST